MVECKLEEVARFYGPCCTWPFAITVLFVAAQLRRGFMINKIKYSSAVIAMQEFARLLQHLFYFMAHEF